MVDSTIFQKKLLCLLKPGDLFRFLPSLSSLEFRYCPSYGRYECRAVYDPAFVMQMDATDDVYCVIGESANAEEPIETPNL